MLTVSLHGIKMHAPHGLYPQEQLLGNDFEVDVDIYLASKDNSVPWLFADYTHIQHIVAQVFKEQAQLLEELAFRIHAALKHDVPNSEKIKVTIRKLNPPMPGDVKYAQVCYED